jgi:hypothetical protein
MEECQGGVIAVMGELTDGGQAAQFGVKVRLSIAHNWLANHPHAQISCVARRRDYWDQRTGDRAWILN